LPGTSPHKTVIALIVTLICEKNMQAFEFHIGLLALF
jgi:hypothetical protein